MSAPKGWTQAHKRDVYQQIAELTRSGLTARVIADRLGVTRRTVARARVDTGVARPGPDWMTEDELVRIEQLLVDGASIPEVARTVGRSALAIRRRFPQYVWTPRQTGEWAAFMRQVHRTMPGI